MTRALQYFFDEAVASLRRGFRTALMAVITIAAAFLVLGGFLLLTLNMERAFARWQEASEFSIYLDDRATPEQRDTILKTLQGSSQVAAADVVSKDQALARFKQSFGALADATAEMPNNPLPASVEVRLRANADPAAVDTLATQMASAPGVSDVRYDRMWMERLRQAASLVRTWGFVLAALFVGAAALTVASVVRLAMVARRDEIHIMQLVGAPICVHSRAIRRRGAHSGRRGRGHRRCGTVDRVRDGPPQRNVVAGRSDSIPRRSGFSPSRWRLVSWWPAWGSGRSAGSSPPAGRARSSRDRSRGIVKIR